MTDQDEHQLNPAVDSWSLWRANEGSLECSDARNEDEGVRVKSVMVVLMAHGAPA